MVLGECVGGECGDAFGAGGRDQVLDEQGAHATVVESVGHGDGDLG